MLNDVFRMTTGDKIDDWALVKSVTDSTRAFYVYKNGSRLAFAFRATIGELTSKDWKKNFDFAKKTLSIGSKSIKAHAGFVKEYLSLRPVVTECMEKYKPSSVIVSGFSQGGAHATLCFRDLLYNYKDTKITGYAFGSPRVYSFAGSVEFEHALKKSESHFHRFEVYLDPVPHLPPWFFDYRHVGRCVTFYGNGFPHSEEMYDSVTRKRDESAN